MTACTTWLVCVRGLGTIHSRRIAEKGERHRRDSRRAIQPGHFLFRPTEPLQIESVPVVELDTFRFQQALLEGVAAMAGKSVGHLAPRVDDTVPGNITCGVEVLEYLADKAGSPWQAGHGGDLAIGGNPALGNTADYSVDRRRGFVALGWGHLEQPRLSGIGSSFGPNGRRFM